MVRWHVSLKFDKRQSRMNKINHKTTPRSESERFVDFARKLVNVPKSEIDKKAEEYHKQRIKERKAARRNSKKPLV